MSSPPVQATQARPAGAIGAHLAVLCLGGILLAVNRSLLYPLLDIVSADLNLTAAQAGSIASVYFLFLLVTQLSLSLFGAPFGLKRLLAGAFLVASVAVLGFGLWTTDYASALFFIALQGLTLGVYWPSAYTLTVAAVPPGKRGMATAIVGAGFAAGHAIGPALAGALYRLTGGWRLPFVYAAIPTALTALAFLLLVHDAPRRAASARPADMFSTLRDRDLFGLFVAAFCSLYGYWIVSIWGPAFFQVERGLSLVSSGLYIALVTAVAVPAGLIIGPLSDRIGRRRISLWMFVLSAAALGAIALVRSHRLLIAALALFGLASKFAWDPINVAWLADLVGNERGRSLSQVVALSSIFAMSSSVVSPLANGWIRDQTGSLQGAVLLGVGVAAVGVMACWRVRDPAVSPAT